MMCGSFYKQSQVELALLNWNLPLLALLCHFGFWCRLATISQDMEGLVTLTD